MQDKWKRIMKQMDEEYPDILPNHFKFKYVGTSTFLYDINNQYDPDYEPPPDPDPDGIKHQHDMELGDLMLKSLRGKQYQIVYKKFWEEKSFAQIGRELNISRQLVYYHYNRAITKLQKLYK